MISTVLGSDLILKLFNLGQVETAPIFGLPHVAN